MMTDEEQARKEAVDALSHLGPVSRKEAEKIAQRHEEDFGIPKKETLDRLHIVRPRIEPAPVPFKPPWDYRNGVVYVAFPGVTEMLSGGKYTESGHEVLIVSSDGSVLTLEQAKQRGFELDKNWHGEYVDWGHVSAQLVVNGNAQPANIRELFSQMKRNILHFVDLPGIEDIVPEQMAELLALWVMGTYFMPVWSAYGYLHFDGIAEECGKSRAGDVVWRMSFWHVSLAANSSLPEWRDTAHFGRTQFLDDVPDLGELPSEARAMLNVGYRRGTQVRLKQEGEKRGWTGKVVDAFAPRVFAAVAIMKPMLRSRTFRVMMQRTSNEEITRRDPSRVKWPHNPAEVRDALYLWAFLNMAGVEERYRSDKMDVLTGRSHEIGRPILTIASIIEEAGELGLFERMVCLLEAMGRESQRDRAKATDYPNLVKAAWACVQRGNPTPKAREVAANMITLRGMPSAVDVGRQLSGVRWVVGKFIKDGYTHYILDVDMLRQEVERLGLGDQADATQ